MSKVRIWAAIGERGEGGRQGKDHPGERDVIIVSLDTVRWLLIPPG